MLLLHSKNEKTKKKKTIVNISFFVTDNFWAPKLYAQNP